MRENYVFLGVFNGRVAGRRDRRLNFREDAVFHISLERVAQHSLDKRIVGRKFFRGDYLIDRLQKLRAVDRGQHVTDGRDIGVGVSSFAVGIGLALIARHAFSEIIEENFGVLIGVDNPLLC